LTAVIFISLDAAAYSRHLRVAASEWAIVVAASLANYLVGQRQSVGLSSMPHGCALLVDPAAAGS